MIWGGILLGEVPSACRWGFLRLPPAAYFSQQLEK